MRHAVVIAHPKRSSFCASIARTCVSALREMGHAVVVRDLYRMKFDPCLRAGEIPAASGYAPGEDVKAERKRLGNIDSFILVYPFWFNAPPAMLKGYVDRVFSLNFGYRPSFHGTAPLLEGRTLTSFSTSGAPGDWVEDTGALRNLMAVFDLHLAAVTGMKVVGHTHLGGVLSSLSKEDAQAKLKAVEQALRACFTTQMEST
ncbi:MAG: dehydrogenase [Caulobacter sp.]|jgi:NAD(P)H dehydrogenase (quinone)|nr:dehydrogenase [Caulobacter sp.]